MQHEPPKDAYRHGFRLSSLFLGVALVCLGAATYRLADQHGLPETRAILAGVSIGLYGLVVADLVRGRPISWCFGVALVATLCLMPAQVSYWHFAWLVTWLGWVMYYFLYEPASLE